MFTPLPQLLKNVRFGRADPLSDAEVKRAIKDGEKRLGGNGRVLIRKSGTEPVIRASWPRARTRPRVAYRYIIAAIESATRRNAA